METGREGGRNRGTGINDAMPLVFKTTHSLPFFKWIVMLFLHICVYSSAH